MCKQEDKREEVSQEQKKGTPLNETWSQDELEDFIEQQGIYIRQ